MKQYVLFFLTSLTSSLFCLSLEAAPPQVDVSPLKTFHPQKPERLVLSNGAVLYLMPNPELPLFSMNIRMKLTPADEMSVKQGAASFLGAQWRKGGTLNRTPKQLDEELENLSASIGTSVGDEAASVSLDCLSKDIDKGISLLSDVLLNPRFDEEQLSLEKSQALEGYRRRNDTPLAISRRAVRQVVYGKDHHYSRFLNPTLINSIQKADLQTLHRKIVSPEMAFVTISGNFRRDHVLSIFNDKLKGWLPQQRTLSAFDFSIKKPISESVVVVDKEFSQSRIVLVQTGITRFDPDIYALEVANSILGGGGPSRLFGQIRSRSGLAYMVGSFVQTFAGPGMTGVVCQTKVGSTKAATEAILAELRKINAEPPTEDELTMAKESIINSFVFRFQSLSQINDEKSSLDLLGYPEDYLETYVSRIQNIQAADVTRACQRFFNPELMKVVIVGDKAKFDGTFEGLGQILNMDVKGLD